MMVPQVEEKLDEWDTKSVVLFGIESHVCVLQTAFDCLDKGIDVHVLADGVSSCNDDEVGIALKVSERAGNRPFRIETLILGDRECETRAPW